LEAKNPMPICRICEGFGGVSVTISSLKVIGFPVYPLGKDSVGALV
jgi:hypothetical protein